MKKIRINGKVCHKFDIAWFMHRTTPLRYPGVTIYYNICTYKQLCEMLYKALKKDERFDIIDQIDWFDNIAPF